MSIITPTRRGFMGLLGLGIAAPAIVRADSIMRVRPIIVDDCRALIFSPDDREQKALARVGSVPAGTFHVNTRTGELQIFNGRQWISTKSGIGPLEVSGCVSRVGGFQWAIDQRNRRA